MTRLITAVVVDIAVDSNAGVTTRKLSCSGSESIDAFFDRVYTTLETLVGREPIATQTWRSLAQELFDELIGWDENINPKPDLMRRASEMLKEST